MNWDWPSIKGELAKKLSAASDWKNEILDRGVYSVLLDVWAFGLEQLALYSDFAWNETTENAILLNSAVQKARDLGFDPPRPSGAEGYVLVGSDPDILNGQLIGDVTYNGDGVVIPKSFGFIGRNGESVYSIEEAVLESGAVQKNRKFDTTSAVFVSDGIVSLPIPGHGFSAGEIIYVTGSTSYNGPLEVASSTTTNSVHVYSSFVEENFTGQEIATSGVAIVRVKEGQRKEFSYKAAGVRSEKFQVFARNIDNDGVIVYVNGTAIPIVDDLFQAEDLSCTVTTSPDFESIEIEFGDGITSPTLTVNDIVKVVYFETKGSAGDITERNIITEAESGFEDVNGNAANVFVRNRLGIVGGSDRLSPDTILGIARSEYAAGLQVNSRESWQARIEEKSYVLKAKVWSVLDIYKGLPVAATKDQNIHFVTAVTTTGAELTASQEQDIFFDKILPAKSPTDIVQWQRLQVIGIRFVVVVVAEPVVGEQIIRDRIVNALTDSYHVTKTDFFQNVWESNYTRVIDVVENVTHHRTQASYMDHNLQESQTLYRIQASITATDDPNPENQILAVDSSIQVWLRRKINGIWGKPFVIANSLGPNIVGVKGYSVSGNINYPTNEITYTVTDIQADTVPSIPKTITATTTTRELSVADTSGLEIGMYAWASFIPSGAKITSIVTNSKVYIDLDTTSAGTETGSFSIDPDPGQSFGVRNPQTESDGWVLSIEYQTEDGNGGQAGDIRLSQFQQIPGFSAEYSDIEVGFE